MTHAQLIFANSCLGVLSYQTTITALVMAGAFLSFLIEYLGNRFVSRHNRKSVQIKYDAMEPGEIGATIDGASLQNRASHNLAAVGHHGLTQPDIKLSVAVMKGGIISRSISKSFVILFSSNHLSHLSTQALASPSSSPVT